ncbi:MAG: aldo/keto reductase, partial [Kofleriaceae bacterium]
MTYPGESGETAPRDSLALPPLVLDTSHLDRVPLDRAFHLLDHAVTRGVTALDCAAPSGDAVVGRWLTERGARDHVALIATGGSCHAGGARIRPDALARDIEISLERLATSQLDVFLLPGDDEDVAVGEVIDALDAHVRAGRIRTIGASGWTVARIRAANDHATAHGRARVAISRVQYSLAVPRTPPFPGCVTLSGHGRAEDRAWYAASELTVLAWSPLGAGFLLGATGAEVEVYDHEVNRARRRRLDEVARARGVTPAAVALGYVRAAGLRVSAEIRCATPEELDESCGALDLALSPADCAALEGPRLTTRPAPRRRVYDAIVVGSGATGGWAAMELTRAGMDVLVVEAGPERDPVLASRVPARPQPRPRQRIQSLHAEHACFAPELFVDDEDQPYRAPADAPFAWIRGRQLGGRTLTWGGLALRMSEFELAPRDGA